jgi:hypothetical protein
MRVAIVGLLVALVVAQPALAKGGARVLLVCGQTECREDRAEAWRQASAIQVDHQHRHPVRGGSFFDIAFLDDSGRPSVALRYVPSLRLTRQGRSPGPVWYRAHAALVRELDVLTAGLAPRPASALEAPDGLPAAYHPPAVPQAAVSDRGASPVVLVAGAVLVLAVAALGQRRLARRRRASDAA